MSCLSISHFRQYWKDNRLRFEIKVRSILSDPDHNRPNGYYYCYQGDNQVVNHYTFTKYVMCVVTVYRLDNSVDIVKLRQGSGKDQQGMAVKAKGLKA